MCDSLIQVPTQGWGGGNHLYQNGLDVDCGSLLFIR